MKDEIILELARRWENDAKEPNEICDNENNKIPNAIDQGRRESMLACANTLRTLFDIFVETRNL